MIGMRFGACAMAALLFTPPLSADEKIEYNRDIRPILAENCFSCHGPDSASRKAKLRLDQFDAAVKAGAITPGNPAASELVRRIGTVDPDECMPPPRTKKTLTGVQKDLLKRWIATGRSTKATGPFCPRGELPCPR